MVTNLMKYNPAFLGDEALIRSFVARTSELERILEVLRENTTGANQHLLIIGPRGIGKTTLVLRTAAEIRADPGLGERWYPIVYGEETYQVSSAGEFWLEALFHVGQQTGDARWRQAYEELLGERNEERLRPRVLAQLMDFADEQGKRLVLVVENLNMLFGGQIGDEDAWILRHTLMNEPRVMLIGTATSRFREMDEYNQALYELFRIIELDPLADDEAQAVWTAATGQTVPRHQLRPIQILTGGNPRLIRILSEFAAKTSFRLLMDDLTRLVDEHTEYFKHHLDNLPPQERKVFVVLADLWDPSTARQIAEAARLDVNVASAQLKRLMDRGAVTTPYKQGRTQFYQVAERMYNIYHLMRRRGQPSSRVQAVVRFMVSLYREDELVQTTRSLVEEAIRLSADERREHFHAYEAILAHAREPHISEQIVNVARLAFQSMPDTPVSLLRLIGSTDSSKLASSEPGIDPYDDAAMPPKGSGNTVPPDPSSAGTDQERADAILDEMLRTNSTDQDRWFRLGLYYANLSGGKEIALQAFERVLALNPENANALANKGTALLELGRIDEAIVAYDRALSIDSVSRGALKGKARALTELGCNDEAVGIFERLLAIAPDDASVLAAFGSVLGQLGRVEEALGFFDRALVLESEDHAETWYNKGTALVHMGEMREALHAYDRALSLNPQDPATWCNKGHAFLQLNQPDRAVAAFDRALYLDPDDATAYHNRGAALNRLGRNEEALADYDHALRLKRSDAATWHNKGITLLELGKFAEAAEAFDHAIALHADDPDMWLNRGAALARLGRMVESLECYDRAIALDSRFVAGWIGRGAALSELERFDEALTSLRHAIVLDETDSDAWANIGATFGRLGRLEEALEAYDRALALAPGSTPAWVGRAITLESLGRTEEACEAYRGALSRDANDWETWSRLAAALGFSGSPQQALEAYEHALRLNSTDAPTWSRRGDMLRQLERAEEALASYDRALELDADYAGAWAGRGFALLTMRRADEAFASFDRCTTIVPESAIAFLGRGLAQRELSRFGEAVDDLKLAINFGNLPPSTMNGVVRLLLDDAQRPEDALAVAEALIARPESKPDTLNTLAWLFFRHGRKADLGAAEAWARTAVEQAPANGAVRHTLACILGAQGKWEHALNEAAVFMRDRELLDSALEELIDFFIDAVASGHSDGVTRVIRSANAEDAFEPLLVAIRRLSGDQVDIAREILEISTDVIEQIEARRRELAGDDRFLRPAGTSD